MISDGITTASLENIGSADKFNIEFDMEQKIQEKFIERTQNENIKDLKLLYLNENSSQKIEQNYKVSTWKAQIFEKIFIK